MLLPAVPVPEGSHELYEGVIQAVAYQPHADFQVQEVLHALVLWRSAHPVTADHDEPVRPPEFPPGDQRHFPVPAHVLSGNSGPSPHRLW
ncbi:hypothetical protein BX18_18010 [Escherichia coli O111:NM str. 2009C-4006]|nr:hypothetical protein BX59_01985 [Escherichia coli O111:NM str. 2010C-4086]EYY78398.1 hypothetical protein BX74_00835 [Escherichia coli O111:NM str. 2010C-4746]EYZ05730.1 hypothetical protein BX69_13720 [Escherichia coli O111:NM str. 2010C-4592]EZE39080.1 hypothetical protein BX18_18010 [Escherichia coli O111:NM str. 2009C-4006]EZH14187.1 hypothetical protein BX13_16530 [Escherichia coli O26:H11 str. 2009C-3612]EZQ24031.1 hypothetical protein BX39_17940 [Escherichia coli O111:NM str. 2010C-3